MAWRERSLLLGLLGRLLVAVVVVVIVAVVVVLVRGNFRIVRAGPRIGVRAGPRARAGPGARPRVAVRTRARVRARAILLLLLLVVVVVALGFAIHLHLLLFGLGGLLLLDLWLFRGRCRVVFKVLGHLLLVHLLGLLQRLVVLGLVVRGELLPLASQALAELDHGQVLVFELDTAVSAEQLVRVRWLLGPVRVHHLLGFLLLLGLVLVLGLALQNALGVVSFCWLVGLHLGDEPALVLLCHLLVLFAALIVEFLPIGADLLAQLAKVDVRVCVFDLGRLLTAVELVRAERRLGEVGVLLGRVLGAAQPVLLLLSLLLGLGALGLLSRLGLLGRDERAVRAVARALLRLVAFHLLLEALNVLGVHVIIPLAVVFGYLLPSRADETVDLADAQLVVAVLLLDLLALVVGEEAVRGDGRLGRLRVAQRLFLLLLLLHLLLLLLFLLLLLVAFARGALGALLAFALLALAIVFAAAASLVVLPFVAAACPSARGAVFGHEAHVALVRARA
mmetsp:Transcript_24490/g.78177  ORF Transcript_24490/g.78177 Transcript_24490/m.78177 type:complete len:507 (-) Transcript_24490:1020-2540(-)